MLKKLAPLFLVIMLGGLFLPLFNCSADGTYQVNGQEVRYSGFVPCGKCVKPFPSNFNFGTISDEDFKVKVQKITKERCGADDGSQIYIHCQLCHFFVMVDGIVSFVLINVVPPLAVLVLVIGGLMFYFGGANPNLLTRGKTLIKGVVIGLFLIYGAYMIVGILLAILGAAHMEPVSNIFKRGVFSIECAVKL